MLIAKKNTKLEKTTTKFTINKYFYYILFVTQSNVVCYDLKHLLQINVNKHNRTVMAVTSSFLNVKAS